MANNKQRYINTRFWNDSYVSELDPIEKLMFIYFLTNEHTNISGIYEIPTKIIGIETGIDNTMIKKVLPRLEKKIRYLNGYVIIKNFVKHQETGSELVKKGILNCLGDLDQEWLKNIVNKGFYDLDRYYLDTLSIPYAKGSNYSNSNSNSNLDSDSNVKSEPSSQVNELIDYFKIINPSFKKLFVNKSQRASSQRLLDTHGLEKLKQMIDLLPKSNLTNFMPVITTPCQLEDKMGQLASGLQRIKNNQTIML